MSKSEQIIERSGAQWVGIQKTDGVPLILFRDPITGSALALSIDSLSVSAARDRMLAARESFSAARSRAAMK